MEVIPAIDIRGGRCVRLEQGDYARETVFGEDPAAVAGRWQEAGADRVVLGTAAVKDRAMLLEALALFGERIVVAVDARDGVVVTEGWLETSGIAAADLVEQLAEMGVARIIYTDTLRDGTLTGPNFPAIEALLSSLQPPTSNLRTIYSGGVSTLEHLRRLAALPLEGVIVGKALYTGDIGFAQAVSTIAS